MNAPAAAGDDFAQRLHRGAVLRLTLDRTLLDDPDIDKRSKDAIVVSALLPDADVWFILCTSRTGHFDRNPKFENDILRWMPGEYSWCKAAVTVADCTAAYKLPTTKLEELHASGQLAFAGDLRPMHMARVDAIMKVSICLSPEQKRWVVPW